MILRLGGLTENIKNKISVEVLIQISKVQLSALHIGKVYFQKMSMKTRHKDLYQVKHLLSHRNMGFKLSKHRVLRVGEIT